MRYQGRYRQSRLPFASSREAARALQGEGRGGAVGGGKKMMI